MRLAGRLAELSMGGKVFFCNSGAEAIECAIKLAQARSRAAASWSSRAASTGARWGRCRPPAGDQAGALRPARARVHGRRRAAVRSRASDDGVAALILEPVQGESGIHPLGPELLLAAREACDAPRRAARCFDEIQCGMGRTGTLWAWQQLGVEPDVMTVAKGLGGGLPIGACVAAPALRGRAAPGDHGSTFAGGPVVAAAANAVVDTSPTTPSSPPWWRRGSGSPRGCGSWGSTCAASG